MLTESLHSALSLIAAPGMDRTRLRDAIAHWSSGRRYARVWAEHRTNTLRIITEAMPERRFGTVVVLGSGPLFDIPLELLSRSYARVLLVDVAHPFSARWRARRFRNVRFVTRDLSCAANAGRPLGFLAGVMGLNWVISANLLSSLAMMAPDGDENAEVIAHLEGLARLKCRVTLVSDTAYRLETALGRVIESYDLLFGVVLPEPDHGWDWIASPVADRNALRRAHEVAAYPDWHAAIRPTEVPVRRRA